MKTTITCLLLAAAFRTTASYASEPDPTKQEAEVQKGLESIVANCEKKKLPPEEEIACIEQGYLLFMGEAAPEGS